MKVTQEKLPDSQIGLEIEIPAEMSKQTYEKVLGQLMRSANIPGFRKGKVPRQILIQRFGTQRINASVLEELVQSSLEKAIEQEKIEAIGNYQLRTSFDELLENFQPDGGLTFSAAVDVAPEVTLTDYQGLTVQAEEAKYDASRVDQVLEEYRDRYSTLIPVEDRAAQMGDIGIVDYKGRIAPAPDAEDQEPQEFPGGSAEDFQIELDTGRFIEGFVEGIVGMQPGETKEIEVTFPESYPQADLAGKPATFTLTLKELKEKELPELDDEFAQEVSEYETLAELRESLEKQFQEEAERKTASNKEQVILDELVKHLQADLPQTLIRQEVNYMLSQTAMRLSQQGIDVKQLFTEDMLPRLREQSRPEAMNRLKRTLALGEVAKQEKIQVDESAVKAKIEEILKDVSPAEQQSLDLDRLQQIVEEDLLKEKIIAWLEESWTVELVPEGTLKQKDEEAAEEDLSEIEDPEVTAEATADSDDSDAGNEAKGQAEEE